MEEFIAFLYCLYLIFYYSTHWFFVCSDSSKLRERVHSLSVYFLELALALDNAGNVLMQHVLNDTLLIKNKETYYFGNKMETISSVIGKNGLTHTLSHLGLALNGFLHWIDKDHAFNSINYNVKLWKEAKN